VGASPSYAVDDFTTLSLASNPSLRFAPGAIHVNLQLAFINIATRQQVNRAKIVAAKPSNTVLLDYRVQFMEVYPWTDGTGTTPQTFEIQLPATPSIGRVYTIYGLEVISPSPLLLTGLVATAGGTINDGISTGFMLEGWDPTLVLSSNTVPTDTRGGCSNYATYLGDPSFGASVPDAFAVTLVVTTTGLGETTGMWLVLSSSIRKYNIMSNLGCL